jgi:VIT1/CCC1 family predicted Fe2+/Mn2+ transporter
MMRDPELALETHAREELGIDPTAMGRPIRAAAISFLTFALGAFFPLIPWLFGGGTVAVVCSIVIAATVALTVGGMLGRMAGRPMWFSALRSLAVAAVAASVTFGVGHLVGVSGT